MRRNHVGPAAREHDSEHGWEVAHFPGGTTLDGVRMAGFRDRASVGLDMQVLPQPVVVVVIGLGDAPLTVESATACRPLRSFVAALSPGPARVRGEHVECVEVCLPPPAAHAVLGVSPRELDGSVNGLEDLWGRHARSLRERLTDATTWQERLALTDAFLSVTDVGGGDGTLLAGVLAAHPGLTGVVLDTAEGLAGTPDTMARHGMEDRCSLIAGDFFHSVPGGSDLYLLKSVLHDWTDDQVVTILSHCRQVLPPGGLVLIVEPVLPDAVDVRADVTDGGATYLSDLNMLVNVGGRERTREDFAEVCRRAGLTLTAVTPLTEAAPFAMIEAVAD